MIEESEVSNTVGDPPMVVLETHLTRPRMGVRVQEDQARVNVLKSQIGDVTSALHILKGNIGSLVSHLKQARARVPP